MVVLVGQNQFTWFELLKARYNWNATGYECGNMLQLSSLMCTLHRPESYLKCAENSLYLLVIVIVLCSRQVCTHVVVEAACIFTLAT